VRCGGVVTCLRASIGNSVGFEAVAAAKGVNIHDVRIAGELSVHGDIIVAIHDVDRSPRRTALGSLSIDRVTVSAVHLRGFETDHLQCNRTHVADGFRVSQITVTQQLDFEHVDVGQELMFLGVNARNVFLAGVSVRRDLSVVDSTAMSLSVVQTKVAGNLEVWATFTPEGPRCRLQLEGISVDSDATLGFKAPGIADLERMRIGGALRLEDVALSGDCLMKGTEVRGDLTCARCEFGGTLDASLIQVGGSMHFDDARLTNVVLAGARISRDFSLGSIVGKVPEWAKGAQLDLHNADIGALSDPPSPFDDAADPWPKQLDLSGFTFTKLVAFGEDVDRSAMPAAALVAWLRRDRSASVQPYVQLAKVLRDSGEIEKANDILYEGRELARRNARRWRWAGLSLLKWTIGYGLGLRYFRALGWVAAFVAIGVVTLWLDQIVAHRQLTGDSRTLSWMIFATLDALLPIITLDKTFTDEVPAHLLFFSKIIFWMLGLAGWVLGSFLVAGLAGLTQKQS
jgi:hypothetical protein